MPFSSAATLYLRLLLRQRTLLLASLAVLFGATSLYLVLQPTQWTARSVLVAKFGREHTYQVAPGTPPVVPTNVSQGEIANSAVEMMRSESLARQVLGSVGVVTLYPELAGDDPVTQRRVGLRYFASDLRISPISRTDLIVIELTSYDPELAASTLNRFVADFQAKYRAVFADSNMTPARPDVPGRPADPTQSKSGDAAQLEAMIQRKADLQSQQIRLRECCAESPAATEVNHQLRKLEEQITEMNRLVNEATPTIVRVVDPAVPPLRPARPGKTLKIVLAFLISAVSSVALATLVELFRPRFSTGAELSRAFSVPILAEMPRERRSARGAK